MKKFYQIIFKLSFIITLLLILVIIAHNLEKQLQSTNQQKENPIPTTTKTSPKTLLKTPPPTTDADTEATPKIIKYTDVNSKPVEAMFYEQLPQEIVKCHLCPWECTLKIGERGICKVRENQQGKLISLSYARPCTVTFLDPIEKKPFYHFLPGFRTLSLATAGCNFGCKYCQNWSISQVKPEDIGSYYLPPEGIIRLAERTNTKIISFTYSEPVVFYEYMLETAKLAKQKGIKTVVVTNGYINPEPLKLLCKYLTAIKIDLKAFNEKFYKEVVFGRLQPVLNTIKTIKEEKVHLEIVYLVIPTLNDNPEEIHQMCLWLKENAGSEVPLHFSRFFPQYKMQNYPLTPVKTLENLREVAVTSGMKYVYVGNVQPGHPGGSTYCNKCSRILIKRVGYQIFENNIVDGKCKFCKTKIYGVW